MKKLRNKKKKSKISPALKESMRLGLEEFENGNYEKAVNHLSNSLALFPDNCDLLSALGYSHLQIGNYEESISVFSDVTILEPDNFQAFRLLSTAFYQIGDWHGAEKALRESQKLRPTDPETLNDLGVLLQKKGDLEEAEVLFRTSMVGGDGNKDAAFNLGSLCFDSERYSEAVSLFSESKNHFPEDNQIRKNLSSALIASGRSEEALDELISLSKGESNDPELDYLFGKAYYGTMDFEKAEEAFNKCLRLEPENILAKESLATVLLRVNKGKDALAIWESVLNLPERVIKIKPKAGPRLTNWEKIGKFDVIATPEIGKRNGQREKHIEISVVIPLFEEGENMKKLLRELQEAMEGIGGNYEIIFIDDGSKDDTYETLQKMRAEDKRIKVLKFRKNYGQTAALSAGFDYAHGDVVVTLDGDLQNDPADIPKLIEKLGEGYDMVSGWRVKRKDTFLTRRLPSIIANKIIGKITGTELHDYGCAMKAYKKGVIKNIRLYGEMHRFIPAVVSWLGAEIAEISVNHRPRIHGKSKYNLTRIWRVILDLINVKFLLSYLTRPLQYFGKIGLIFISMAIIIEITALTAKFGLGMQVSDSMMFFTAVFMVLMGIQFITLGLMAEIVIRTYHESQEKPIYIIKEILD